MNYQCLFCNKVSNSEGLLQCDQCQVDFILDHGKVVYQNYHLKDTILIRMAFSHSTKETHIYFHNQFPFNMKEWTSVIIPGIWPHTKPSEAAQFAHRLLKLLAFS